MSTAIADLDSFVSGVRESLPLLHARQTKNAEQAGIQTTALHAEVKLREDILNHYDKLSVGILEDADVLEILRTLHAGVQHCAQHEIDRAADPENSEEVFACLGALADLDDRLVKLGAKKPARGVIRKERHTSD